MNEGYEFIGYASGHDRQDICTLAFGETFTAVDIDNVTAFI